MHIRKMIPLFWMLGTGLTALAELPAPAQAKVLFIGNSLFGSSDGGVPGYSDAALRAMGQGGLDYRMIGNWGESLTWGLSNVSKYNTILPDGTLQGDLYKASAQLKITDAILNGPDGIPGGTDHWDYVVLQGYGDDDASDCVLDATQPDGVRGAFFDTVVILKTLADQVGAQTLLYMRWPNNPEATSVSWFNSQIAALSSNYDTIANHLGLEVIPIALITEDLLFTNPPDTSVLPSSYDRYNFLYGGDNIHQSDYGKGMFAYAVAALFARLSPVGVPFEHGGYIDIPPSIDDAIQKSVWRVIAQREPWADPNAVTRRIIPNVNALTINEGSTATFSVCLNAAPTSTVTITTSRTSGDTDLSVVSGTTLQFSSTNWDVPQSITLTAAEDSDGVGSSATFTAAGSGLAAASIMATEQDNDLPEGVGILRAEENGRVTVEAEHYFSRTENLSKLWTLQTDGVQETYDFSNVRNGNYLTLLPDSSSASHVRATAGTVLLIDHDAYVDYKVRIATPGTYVLHLRATGRDNASDSFYAGIVELRDGDGGVNGGNPEASEDILADWYRYLGGATATFGWISMAEYESDDSSGSTNLPAWQITQPGTYTIRVNWREDGIALDALVLQLSSLAAPSGTGPAESPAYVEAVAPPAAPSGLTASTVSSHQIDLSWTDDADNEAGFKIERRSGTNGFVQIGTADMNSTIFSSASLTANTLYTYRVCAFNSVGNSDYSAEASATTSAETGPGLIVEEHFTDRAGTGSTGVTSWPKGSITNGLAYGNLIATGGALTAASTYSNLATFDGTVYADSTLWFSVLVRNTVDQDRLLFFSTASPNGVGVEFTASGARADISGKIGPTVSLTPASTNFIVGKLILSSTGDETVTLWINPTNFTSEATLSSSAVGSSSLTTNGTMTFSSSSSIYPRQNGATTVFDEIRLATSLAGVTPTTGSQPPPAPYDTWAQSYGLVQAEDGDDDGDGTSNFLEYALRGNPTNSSSGAQVEFKAAGTNGFEYIYVRRTTANSGLTYRLETSTNLVYGVWTNSGYTTLPTAVLDADFEILTNRISTADGTGKFIRLRIQQ
jgi:hypothetical protein